MIEVKSTVLCQVRLTHPSTAMMPRQAAMQCAHCDRRSEPPALSGLSHAAVTSSCLISSDLEQ